MKPQPERCIPGFENINRYWDGKHNKIAAKILPGEFYVSSNDEIIVTLLGSCISVCVYDPLKRLGGMNHFMLPITGNSIDHEAILLNGEAGRYGNYAMEHMINEMLKQGAEKSRLKFKVFGGGKVLKNATNVGDSNIEFVFDYLSKENYAIESSNVGDIYPRKIIFYLSTGDVFMKKLQTLHNDTIIERERCYKEQLEKEKLSGDVELF